MVNTEDFSKRLKLILDYYDLTASALADSIDIQRSSISHILSGRNKPSLDFVLKLLKNYPEVELNWLMNGKGKFPKQEDTHSLSEKNLFSEIEENNTSKQAISVERESEPTKIVDNLISNASNEIEQIVIFYKSGKFKSYKP